MKSKLLLILIGVAVGLLGKAVLAPWASEKNDVPRFAPAPGLEPLNIVDEETSIDLTFGLVPPLGSNVIGQIDSTSNRNDLLAASRRRLENLFDSFAHDDRATFHAHGEQQCASGCAASRHPTEPLPVWKYHQLIKQFATEPIPTLRPGLATLPLGGSEPKRRGGNRPLSSLGLDSPQGESDKSTTLPRGGSAQPAPILTLPRGGSAQPGREKQATKPETDTSPNSNEIASRLSALDQLVYYGLQTRNFIEQEGTGDLDVAHAKFLRQQLGITHAVIQIRVLDEAGVVRTWLPETRVPFDRRHVFDMEEKNLQPLVTSGTVKRVGLDYLWVRL